MSRDRKSFKIPEGQTGYVHREHRSKKNRRKKAWNRESTMEYKRNKENLKNEQE